MSFSIQTNLNSLVAQENLRVNSNFQSTTIQRLTSGYRINSSGDDAAGLSIANKFRSDTAELAQGVRNANDGVSQLQIIDGGMNNVSKMLDRLRTLAAQASSQTFTGSLKDINSEFQGLLGEIDRQAQSIGLETNGQFAKPLSVFMGGGGAGAGAISTDNGTVKIDLSASAIDSRSLGLKGMQAVGGAADISNTSAASSVSKILADTTNNTTQVSGISEMYFSGAGFSDAGKVKIAIDTTGVTDINSLVTAVNAAIQYAGNGNTPQASAFRNAGITATVVTDGATQKLGFTSSSAAFQVQAGDRMANAFLGNITTGAAGDAIASTLTGGATSATGGAFAPTNVTLRVTGAGMAAKDFTFGSSDTTIQLAVADLTRQINNDADMKAAGITVSGGGTANGGASTDPLVFTSYRGEKFSVQVTNDVNNALGFGAFTTNAGAGQAVDYTQITAGVNYSTSTARGASNVAHMEFSINGGASSGLNIDLDGGDAAGALATGTAATGILGGTFRVVRDGVAQGAGNITFVAQTTAQVVSSSIGELDGNGKVLNVAIDGIATSLTLTAGATTTTLAAAEIAAFGATHGFTAGYSGGILSVTSSAAGAHTLTLTGNAVAFFSLSGATSTGVQGDDTVAKVAQKINGGNFGVTASVNASGNLEILDNTKGAHTLTFTGSSAVTSALPASTVGTARSLQSVVDAINTKIGQTGSLQAAGLEAVVSGSALKIMSNNNTFFRVTAGGTATSDLGFGVASASTFAGATTAGQHMFSANSQGATQSTAISFAALVNGGDDQTITVAANDPNGVMQTKTITLQNDAAGVRNGRSIDEALSYINQQLQSGNNPTFQKIVAVKEYSGGAEKINFISALGEGAFSVGLGSSANGNGMNAGTAVNKNGTLYGAGSNATVDSAANALKAVVALSAAVSALGSAQAAVGKAQNQLSYAVGLAQSQISSFSAAESRIRDADVAAEAANLTKASVLQQASMAAMAQANSAPQAVLALLRG